MDAFAALRLYLLPTLWHQFPSPAIIIRRSFSRARHKHPFLLHQFLKSKADSNAAPHLFSMLTGGPSSMPTRDLSVGTHLENVRHLIISYKRGRGDCQKLRCAGRCHHQLACAQLSRPRREALSRAKGIPIRFSSHTCKLQFNLSIFLIKLVKKGEETNRDRRNTSIDI
jgi:hypothetical protein